MYHAAYSISMTCIFALILAQDNALTDEEKAAGWKLLFDGKSVDLWRGIKKKTAPDGWKAADGALVRDGKGGDIISVDQYANFEFSFEWKISAGGNSGVMYRISEDAGAIGHEYQVLDNDKHADGKNALTRTGGAYALFAPLKDAALPAGQWNKGRIVVDGNKVEHWLNGEKTADFEIGGEEWLKRVAASKFKNNAKFGREAKGHLLLQDHGDKVEYRNLKIRPK